VPPPAGAGTIVAPPPGTLAVMHETKIVEPDGSRTDSSSTTYRSPDGITKEQTTKTVVPPPPPPG
jgi:hypothetical protein